MRAAAAEGADAATGELAAAEASEPVASAPVEILVAEDNELNADIIASILTEEGFAVTVACNGAEAVAAFEASPTGHFAAIFMDAQMPVMDGYAAARAIRDLPRDDAGTVLIFACTASTFEEDRRRALDAGMDDFLPKPLNVGLMLQKLEAVRKGLS
ncbi:response regulator [Adlercreutzia muris]|uniref:Response regulator n=1 Tax=Adlercreutzia muris TaxID=1796610 RepID=A0A7C8FSZ7_9ACTN|nr:response regulator [Adlercreutzia muris]